jgi:hypothetical protein
MHCFLSLNRSKTVPYGLSNASTSEPERYAAYTREYLGWGVFALMPR